MEGISGRCSVHPRLGGLVDRGAPIVGFGSIAAGAMVAMSALSCDFIDTASLTYRVIYYAKLAFSPEWFWSLEGGAKVVSMELRSS